MSEIRDAAIANLRRSADMRKLREEGWKSLKAALLTKQLTHLGVKSSVTAASSFPRPPVLPPVKPRHTIAGVDWGQASGDVEARFVVKHKDGVTTVRIAP